MNGAPQPIQSPVLPFPGQTRSLYTPQQQHQQDEWAPSVSRQSDPVAMHQQQQQAPRGLGIYNYSMPSHSSSGAQNIPSSPQQSEGWSHSSMVETGYPSPQQPPNIFTAAFDPFADYSSSSPQTAPMSATAEEAPGLIFCQTPPSHSMASHRSSISTSSCSPRQHSEDHYHPQVLKFEDSQGWYSSPSNDHVLQRSLTTGSAVYPSYSTAGSPMPGAPAELYKGSTGDWTRAGTVQYPLDYQSLVSNDNNMMRSRFDNNNDGSAVVPGGANRIKKKRQRTTPEEATHECRTCGKLFKRSYNWKSHMETHNPERKYPHPCTAMVGNHACPKKFQRKTDLDRHYDSVHMKARNHRCNLCGNRFARRDTLRRHSEDGCPKRFELGFPSDSASAPSTSTNETAQSGMTSSASTTTNANENGDSQAASNTRWSSLPNPFSTSAPVSSRDRAYSMGNALTLSAMNAPDSTSTSTSFFGRGTGGSAGEYVASPIQASGNALFVS